MHQLKDTNNIARGCAATGVSAVIGCLWYGILIGGLVLFVYALMAENTRAVAAFIAGGVLLTVWCGICFTALLIRRSDADD